MCEEQIRRAPEELPYEVLHRMLAGYLLGDERKIAVRAALSLVLHESLFFEDPQHSEYGIARQRVIQMSSHLRHATGPVFPENLHHVRFAISQRLGHVRNPYC